MDLVHNFLNQLNVSVSDTIVVAVSFGPDSMALLDIIKKIYKYNRIICAHVHHNHRKESDEEALKLEEYCNKNNIVFEIMKIESYINNRFTEEEARNKRYEFFDYVSKKYNSKYIFTAHHGDDLVETILMRLVRGSTLKGYSGIRQISKRKSYDLIRPLLYVTKEDILKYCLENNIPYAVDKSNLDDEYTRNRYRNKILPLLKEENIAIHKQFLKFSTILHETDEYINDIVNDTYNRVVINNKLDIELLLDEKDFIIKRVLMKYLYDFYGDNILLLADNHINLILDMIKNRKSNDKICLPNKNKLIKSYNVLYFDKEEEYNNYCYIFEDYLNLSNGFILKKVNKLDTTTNFITALDSNEIKLPLYVRNRVDGDKIDVLGLNGYKKVKDIYIDEKISLNKRKTQPILVDSNGTILWIPGIKKSKYDKSKTGNYDIIIKYIKEGEL